MKKSFIILVSYLFLLVLVAELIGFRAISITENVSISFLPLVWSVLIAMILGLRVFRKGFLTKVYSQENVEFCGKYMMLFMLPLMARYGADVAPALGEILSKGYIFFLQELGNVGTVFIGVPLALLVGLKRETIGATLGIGREGELAYISEKYTLDSDEGRGILAMYLFGTLFGALFFSVFAPLLLNFGFDVRALAMASGVGSGSMMSAASSALVAAVPDMESTILAYASASQLLTSFLGTYTMVFLAVPLQRFLFGRLTGGKYDE